MIANKNAFHRIISLELLRDKLKNVLGNSGNLVSQKCSHLAFRDITNFLALKTANGLLKETLIMSEWIFHVQNII